MLLLCCACVSDVVDENGRCVEVDVVMIARRSVGDFVNACSILLTYLVCYFDIVYSRERYW